MRRAKPGRLELYADIDVRAYLSGLVLCDLMLSVLSAVLALAIGASGLWDVDLLKMLLASSLDLLLSTSFSSASLNRIVVNAFRRY